MRITPRFSDAISGLTSALDLALMGKSDLRVLEAGCGSSSHVPLPGRPHVTGIDVSEAQLLRNPLLDESILGDIQSYPLSEGAYDVVVCWDVLEHLRQPTSALRNLVCALRPGAVLILAVPNILSAKGLLTACTPFRFHVWSRRVLFREATAGMHGYGPYPTNFRFAITRRSLRSFARERGLTVVFECMYESRMHMEFKKRHRILSTAWAAISILIAGLSLGIVSARRTDILMMLQSDGGHHPLPRE
jgi:SAM-dependent methyltransferase